MYHVAIYMLSYKLERSVQILYRLQCILFAGADTRGIAIVAAETQ